MPRHGDCKHFVPEGANSASSEGMCLAHMDEEGMPQIVNIFKDVDNCKEYEPAERIRTDHAEFLNISSVRAARGFDEK